MKFNVHRSPDEKVGEIELQDGEISADLPDAQLESVIEGLGMLRRYDATRPPRANDTAAERKESASSEFLRDHIAGVLSTEGLALVPN